MVSPELYKPALAHTNTLKNIDTLGQSQTSQIRIPEDGAQMLVFLRSKTRG